MDFIGTSAATVFPPGVATITHRLKFTVRDDDIPEGIEAFQLRVLVTNGDGVVVSPSVAVIEVIASDDGYGVFSFKGVSRCRSINRVHKPCTGICNI